MRKSFEICRNYSNFATTKTTDMLKRLFFIAALAMVYAATAHAQYDMSRPFKATIYNKEYDVYMRLNLYDNDVVIGWQEMLGELPGFLAKSGNNYCWLITEATVDGKKAELEMVNDSGSDDLNATLTFEGDSVYTLRRKSGAVIKVPNSGKWQKLPSTLIFKHR